MRIRRLPAALVTAVERCACRLLRAALCTELTLVYRTASALPAICISRLGRTAFGTEFSGSCSTARTSPTARHLGLGLLCTALGAEFTVSRSTASASPSACRRNGRC